ncbi:MAG: hypothetical protein R3B99_18510 [Polyangiales bacterium]
MKSKLDAFARGRLGAGRHNRSTICTALADAVVEHLAANADVRITTSRRASNGTRPRTIQPLAPAADVVLAGALE